MAREPSIPLFLWVATAALAHILWGGGSEQVAQVIEEKNDLSRFARAVRSHVERSSRPIEVELLDESANDDAPSDEGVLEPEPREPQTPPEQLQEEDDRPPRTSPKEDRKAEAAPTEPEERKRDPEVVQKPDQRDTEKPESTDKPKDEPKQKEPKPEAEEKKPLQVVEMPRRVAVRQHVDDEEQKDNPDAEFIADHANHTDKREQAHITSTDQMDKDPTPGLEHQSPSQDPGNAHVTELAQSDTALGNPERVFAESPEDGRDQRVERDGASQERPNDPTRAVYGEAAPRTRGERNGAADSQFASRGQKAQQAQTEHDDHERLLAGEEGSFTVAREQQAQKARAGRVARQHRAAPRGNGGLLPSLRGSESMGMTPGGLNPNLTPLSALSAIGQDQLNRERKADGERRLSKHRGSFRPQGLERWRSAIENYVATVQPGNQTALNTARAPFASYLNRIHQRLHDSFAFSFLPSLDSLPSSHALNRPDLKTHLEIVLSKEDGRVVRMGVTRASGATAFDVGALEAVDQAAPYGAPPPEIVSPDGNVYLHWEFYRNPHYACSTYFARPYILRVSPTPAPVPAPPPTPATPEEQQHGLRNEAERDGTSGQEG